MPYPPFENNISVDGFVRIQQSGKESIAKHQIPSSADVIATDKDKIIIVIGKHKYYSLFSVQLIQCSYASEGAIKGPLTVLKPINFVWKNNNPAELKFYLSAIKFQTLYEKSIQDIDSLKALIQNPLGYEFYWHDHTVAEKINLTSISPIKIFSAKEKINILVNRNDTHFTIHAELYIGSIHIPLSRVSILFDYFIVVGKQWYLCENVNSLNVIQYFCDCDYALTLSYDVFRNFQHDVLSKMEIHTTVEYCYLKPATATQRRKAGMEEAPEKIIYLSDLSNYVTINPVIKYGQTEIPVLTKRHIHAHDKEGNRVRIERDVELEDEFIALLLKQCPEFVEQLEDPLLYFYVPKNKFVNEDWFLPAFEDWRNYNITILGFNELKDNKLNSSRAKISIQVSSGLNWFNAAIEVRFGKNKVSLKTVQKSIVNKSKYIQLDDGTLGILPEEWMKKFQAYFQASDVIDDNVLQISKTKYTWLDSLYEAHELQDEVKAETNHLKAKLATVSTIQPVQVSEALTAQLRPYQQEGLNWLNFLDDLSFGGCLADDMGLGKSIQIIAFILHIQSKRTNRAHLIVVPTTLLYSWKEEFQKFSPQLKIHIHHGTTRLRNPASFNNHDVIITSYGTLVTDVPLLRKYGFDYIFLDESQNIKNSSSLRYKAARLLQSRNKIIISGTPLENNTLDLYAQFSFVNPGLLGTRQYFKNTYAIPIDKFKSNRSALALQSKIGPFILRRTKSEVAQDLPDKTEMVIYCEMDSVQRATYNKYEKEFRDFISATTDDEIPKSVAYLLKGLTRLRQICNSPALVSDSTLTADASTKIDILIERIINLASQHKILVFSQFVSMLDLIEKRLSTENIPFATLTGKTTKRERVVNEFQNNEQIRVFLISLKAGGTGLNLTAADYVFIVDPWWNPAVENQAIDRVYRIGQNKNVIAIRLICKDTIEEKIMTLQEGKTKLASAVLDTDSKFITSLTKNNLMALFGI